MQQKVSEVKNLDQTPTGTLAHDRVAPFLP